MLIKRASKSTIGESNQSIMMGNFSGTFVPLAADANGNLIGIMSGSFSGSIIPLATDSLGRILSVSLTSGSNHEQWYNSNITTTPSTHIWSDKAYSVVIQNFGPNTVHIGFDETASTATYLVRPKFAFGGDIQHNYLSLVASTVSSTVFCIATW